MDSPIPQIVSSGQSHTTDPHRARLWVIAILVPLVLGIFIGVLTGPRVASAPTTNKEVPSSFLSATCLLRKDKPQVAISWQAAEGANKNVLMKEEDGVSARKGLSVELVAPFKAYSYADTEVSFGKKYTYIIDTGMLDGWERVTVDVSQAACLKSNI